MFVDMLILGFLLEKFGLNCIESEERIGSDGASLAQIAPTEAATQKKSRGSRKSLEK